ncbi:MAG TPA: ABC transporter permease [Rhodanobacteraceae bacterium]|nr:ABC transporter permease [Rhodanobacteraceae bacterium]
MDTAIAMSPARIARAWLVEAKYEFLRLLRTPSFALPTILFPSLFYLLFGVLLNGGAHHGGMDMASYMLAGYSAFGVMAPGLFGFGVVVAMEREHGLLTLKRALPMPPGAYLFAKMLMAMLFAAIVVCLLMLLAVTLGHVRMPLGNWSALLITDVLGVLPFCAIGLFVGTLVGGQGAPAVVNLIYLPMSFLSGLWIPLPLLPKFLQQLAPLWPATHLGQIAFSASGAGGDHRVAMHAMVLAGFTLFFFAIARRRLRRAG